ncbi:hypothetical protein BWI17_15135 [Betaproteobacteria bacterium GR16-43]|nr:hypothetical protein BWI17_15135 [Betaproteobacteria bacterium GR16-43]
MRVSGRIMAGSTREIAMKTSIVLLLGVVFVSGCSTAKYATRPAPIAGTPGASFEIAANACQPEAGTAAVQARAKARDQLLQEGRGIGSGCTAPIPTSMNGHYQNIDCRPETAAQASQFGEIRSDPMQVVRAGEKAWESVLARCLAGFGWKLERYCVEGCGSSG